MDTNFHEIVNENAPKLKNPHFIVDYEVKDVEKPFPSVASYMVFCGKSRSGKSSLITSILTNRRIYRNAFHNVIICIPKHSFSSMSEKDNPFLALDQEKVYHDFNYDVLENIYNQIIAYASEEEDTLLLIDDYASELKNRDLLKLLNSLVNNRRHLRLSIWMSVQTYKSIPLSNRKTINVLVLFKCSNKAEIKAIWEEMTFLSKDVFFDLLMYVFKKPYDYIVIDRDKNEYYRKFNKIEIYSKQDAAEKDKQKETDKKNNEKTNA